ncbi:hypothetical protein FW778_08940 [Ginsengibacter hankyongi]|uniref:Uncharacterized protein n=1 Tax=Ginsengibacter hankyongi TaxID=2607284 RepID=A0A5J5ILX3_9BACT|nr:hypothetical protein [Ginsengibacter hankyongi]KAA9042126.1 hypothetical protein FW778_08940 [Ginsengibacter hankyongi]
MMDKIEKLDTNRTDILKKFITGFLPKRGNKRKGEKNEIEYISSTIDRIFSKYFDFNVSSRHILDAFEELGYDIFLKKSLWNAEKKEDIPSNNGNRVRLDGIYADYHAAFIYVDIEPRIVGQLRLVTSGLPSTTSKEKLSQRQEIEKRINLFKQTIKVT